MRVIITSLKDIAAMNIKKILIDEYGFEKSDDEFDGNKVYQKDETQLVTIKKDSVYSEYLDTKFNPDLYIFASRHRSESGLPCLSTHSIGNFSDNAVGGNKKELGICPSTVVSGMLNELYKNSLNGFEVCLEVTHHGPTELRSPVVFVEVGSTEEQWENMGACSSVARSIMRFKPVGKSAIGFGGPHYAPKFTKLTLQGWAIGHICPKYQLGFLDRDLFKQMVEKTLPRPKTALVDKKGTKGKLKNLIKELADDFGIDVEMV